MVNKNKELKIMGVIPARYKSSRFEGKPLAKIAGIPMIKRTYMQAKQAISLDRLVVATDDQRIFDFCKIEDIPVVMTSCDCLTGTDRIAEVAAQSDFDFYINIQGDEPVIDPKVIEQLIQSYKKYGDAYIAYNLYKIIDDTEEINSNTIIKVVVNEIDELIYMSRLPIPFSNSKSLSVYRKQVPVYGFTAKSLAEFSKHKKTINEQFEDIEMLRFIDLGYKIKMIVTDADSISVDIPSDVDKVEHFILRNGDN